MDDEELDFEEEPEFGIDSLLYDTSDNVDKEVDNQNKDNKSDDSDVDSDDNKDKEDNEDNDKNEDNKQVSDKDSDDYYSETDEKLDERPETVDKKSDDGIDEEVYEEASAEFQEVVTKPKQNSEVIVAQFSEDEEEEVVINRPDESTKTNDKPQQVLENETEDPTNKAFDRLENLLEIFENTSKIESNSFESSKNASNQQTVKKSGHQSVKEFGHQSVEKSGQQSVEKSGHQSIKGSGDQSVKKSGQQSVVKSGQQSVVKSGQQSVVKSGQQSVVKSGQQSVVKSGQQSVVKSGQQSVVKSGQQSVVKSGQQSVVKSGQQSVVKSGQQSVVKSGHQSIKGSGDQSVKKSGQQSVKESKHQSVKEPTNKSVKETANQSVKESANKSVKESANKSVKESANKSVKESANKSVKESANKSVKESANKSVKESANKSVKESANKSVKESANKSVKESANKSVKEFANKSVKESANKSVKEFGHQLAKPSKPQSTPPVLSPVSFKVLDPKVVVSKSPQKPSKYKSVETSGHQSVKESEHKSVKESENQLIKSSGHQSMPRLSFSEPSKASEPKMMSKPNKSNESQPKSSVTSLRNLMPGSNTALLEEAIINKRKTLDLDRKYYESMRIYLREGKIIGYKEDDFKAEAKLFRLKSGKLYFQQNKEVIDTEVRQTEIANEYHINAKAKAEKSRHRGVDATVRDISRHFFWGTIKFDVENVINKCRVCNPLEYDLKSYQLWKYIEIGVIESVLIVRDLNQKSSIFSCAFLEDLTPDKLSKHLLDLFKTYGTPNAIRFVFNEQSKTDFVEDFSNCLKRGLLLFIEEIEFVSHNSAQNQSIKLPMVDIKVHDNSQKCPKSEKELETIYAPIDTDEEMSIFYIFCCNKWLINESVFNTILLDIKNFIQKFTDWKSKISSLSLYFQINGTNLKANEEEEEIKEVSAHKGSKTAENELKRLKEHVTADYYADINRKRAIKQKKLDMSALNHDSSSESGSDDNLSIGSSKHSVASNKKVSKNKTNESKELIKEMPFRHQLREQRKQSIELIDIDDSSQLSFYSLGSASSGTQISELPNSGATNSTIEMNIKSTLDSAKYDTNGICQPCIVSLTPYTEKYIERALAGQIDFEPDNEMDSEDDEPVMQRSPEILDNNSNDSGTQQMEETVEELRKSDKNLKELENNRKKASVTFNLSESGSSDEEEQQKSIPTVKSKSTEKPEKVTTIVTKVLATPRNKRKRNPIGTKNSDEDSDYDVRKDLNLGNQSSKRQKTNNSSNNSKSKQKKTTVNRISKRLVAPDLTDSESNDSSDDKQKHSTKSLTTNPKNNSTKKVKTVEKKAEKTAQVYECSRCDFRSNERQNWMLHTAKHKNDPKTQVCCESCVMVFYSKEELERHKDAEHPPILENKILFGCDKCKEFHCYSEALMESHLIDKHIEDLSYMKTTSKFRCSICKSFSAANKELMSAHLVQKHRSYKCAFDCPFVAPDFQTLERHAKSMHSKYGLPFRCRYCDYCTSVFGSLVKHRENSHVLEFLTDADENPLNKCGLCDITYNYDDTNAIIEHFHSSHSTDFNFFVCKSCNRRIRSFPELKKHSTFNHGVGPADGLEEQIANISDLFQELRQQLNEKRNQTARIQSTNETQNAIAGLMDEHFVETESTNDLVAAAFNFAIIGDIEDEPPTISIADNGITDDYAIIEQNADGLWNPVND